MKKIITYLKSIKHSLPPEVKKHYHTNDMFGIGTAVSGIIQGIGNDKDRKQQKEQNEAQREHEIAMWDKTNLYNTPVEQMKRLQAGGLNPNLVYGSGTNVTAPQINPSRPEPLPARNWGESMGGAIQGIADLSLKQKQKDLLEAQAINTMQNTENTKSEQAFRDTFNVEESIARKYNLLSNARRTETGNEADKFRLSQEQRLDQTTLDMKKTKLQEMQINNAQEQIKLANLPVQQSQQIMETYQRIINMKANLQGQNLENGLKSMESELMKSGLTKNSPLYQKLFAPLFPDIKAHNDRAWNNVKKGVEKAKSIFKNR